MNSSPELAIFRFGEYLCEYDHLAGDPNCQVGWCNGGDLYPCPCKCGGLIHANFGDEDYDGGYWLYMRCDRCGEDYEEAADEVAGKVF